MCPAHHRLRDGGVGKTRTKIQGCAEGGEGSEVREAAVHASRHVRRRLHLRARQAAQVLYCRHVRYRPEATDTQDSWGTHHVPPAAQVYSGASTGGCGGWGAEAVNGRVGYRGDTLD